MSSSLQESMEAIAFQTTSNYPKLLVALFEKAMSAESDRELNDICGKITSLTQDVTGVWIEPQMVESGGFLAPYIVNMSIKDINALSPINQVALKRLENYDLENLKGAELITGTVDLKKGKVTGFFTKIRSTFSFSKSFLSGFFTPMEAAALYLHETGHAYTTFEWLGETMRTNIIMAEVIGRMDSAGSVEKRFRIGQAALKLADVSASIDENTGTEEITALVLEGQVARMQRDTGSRWYDVRLGEVVADQFASRWMMGAHLSTALAKLERSKGIFAEAGYDPKWLGLFVNFANLTALPFTSVSKGVSTLVLKSLAQVSQSFSISLGLNVLVAYLGGSGRYNTVTQRIQAQRRELVMLLKDRKLAPEIINQALLDIKMIDEELAKVHPFSDVYGELSRWTINLVSGIRKDIDDSAAREELANNRLYELSAAMKGNTK